MNLAFNTEHRKTLRVLFFVLIAMLFGAFAIFWLFQRHETERIATKRTFTEHKAPSFGDDVVVRLSTKYSNGHLMYRFTCKGSEPYIRDLMTQKGGHFGVDFVDKDGFTLHELNLAISDVHTLLDKSQMELSWESSFDCSSDLYRRIANWNVSSNFNEQPSPKSQNVAYNSAIIPAPPKPIQRVIHGVALMSHFSVLQDRSSFEQRQGAEVYLKGLIPEDEFKKRSDYNASMGYKILTKRNRAVGDPLETHLFIIKDQVYAAEFSFNEHCSFLQILAPLITDYGMPEIEQSGDRQTYKWHDRDTELTLSLKAEEANSDRTRPISFSLRYSDNALRKQFEEGKKALGLSQ